LYLVSVLALELGGRGITVNGVIPTAIDGAGIFTESGDHLEMREFVKKNIPMGRMGTAKDVADVAEFLAGGFVFVREWAKPQYYGRRNRMMVADFN
jgi:3-oxoacyl-[acyl-carrier protein] reductase